MKINIICKQSKKEDKYIKPFAEFYLSCYFPKIKEVDINCPDENNQQKAPDYFLAEPKIAVEIKGVHERKEIEKDTATSHNLKRLQSTLDEFMQKENYLNYVYYLNYPWMFKVRKGKEKSVAEEIIREIKEGKQKIFIKDVGAFEIVSKSESKEGKIILAASIAQVRSINPAGTIHQNIAPKITTANQQLGTLDAKKRILLLVNKYFFGDRINDFIEALTYSYKDLLNYKNIEEIWLQIEKANSKFHHELLYTRDFLFSFDKKQIKPSDENQKQLFKKWFYPLSKLGDEYKEKLFSALKQFLKNEEPHKAFTNNFVREEMVRLGIWLAEKERFDDVIWLIDKFIDDPDPKEPDKYFGDPEFNYHQQIANGLDPHIVTTVLGCLAWVVQKLALREEYIAKALDYTKRLLGHKNLYVKLQAIIPLIEIAARRQWLDGWSKRPRVGKYKEFHKLVFYLVDLVAKNPNYKAIAKWLCNVFAYYKDLSTEEAEQVLDALKITEESAGLFVYFGVFRQRHYKNQDIKYNGEKLEERLKEMIKNNEKEDYRRLRASISWYLWKILDENRNEFETLQPFIDLILEQPYQKDIYDDIERIISDWIKDRPDICIKWYKQMLSKVSDFVIQSKNTLPQGSLWLKHTSEIIDSIAKYDPDELLELMKQLVSFWKEGAFIGNPKRLFESYKLVSVESRKEEIKKEFQKWYNSMKRLNPKLEKVEWD
jgi:hypothetical protein